MDPRDGIWSEIFNGEQGFPDVRSFIIRGLTPGLGYKFKVKGAYQNGYTEESVEATIYTCTTPSSLSPPKFTAATSTSMTL
jgi:hypothetical protein